MGAHLLQGNNQNNVYEWPPIKRIQSSSMQACVDITTSSSYLHAQLGHPSFKVL